MVKKIVLLIFLSLIQKVSAQNDSNKSKVKFTGYLETYYCYDFENSKEQSRPNFAYSHNRLNEVNLNLGFVKAAYLEEGIRGNIALMSGTYTGLNLASEPGVFRNILEANVGVKISKNNNLWIDAGIFPSHIGFESAIGKDCWNLTRSILAENSPYYESGLKMTYNNKNEKWTFSGLLLNGWQRIQKEEGNSTIAAGHQITFKPNSNITLNSSSFFGSVKPDSIRLKRYFHNLYSQIQLNKKLGITIGLDYGIQQQVKDTNTYFQWFSPIVILKYQLSKKLIINLRGEYYSDKNQVIISTGTSNGFQTNGYSINLDYIIKENVVWRLEARQFDSKDKVFLKNKQPSSQNFFMSTALAISF